MEEVKRDQNGKWLPGKSANEATQFTHSSGIKKYTSPELLQQRIDEYFEANKKEKRNPTISGMALHLGFVNRKSLYDYRVAPGYEIFHDIIEVAKSRIEAILEENLVSGKGSTIGTIFSLKNNYNWADKQEITHSLPDAKVTGFNYISPTDESNS